MSKDPKFEEVDRPEPKPAEPHKAFWLELAVGSRMFRFPIRALSKEEASHHALFLLAREFPTVRGYNVLSEDQKTLLEQVDGETFIAKIINPVMQVAGMQAFRTMVPVVTTGKDGQNLQELMRQARGGGLTGPPKP